MRFSNFQPEPHLMLVPTKNRPTALTRCLSSAIEMESAHRNNTSNKHYPDYREYPTIFYIADDSPTNSARSVVQKIASSAPDYFSFIYLSHNELLETMSASLRRVDANPLLKEAFMGKGIGPSRNRAMLALLRSKPNLKKFCFCDDDMVFGFDEFELVENAISLKVSPISSFMNLTRSPSSLCEYAGEDTFYGGWDDLKGGVIWKKSHIVTTNLKGYFNWNPSLGGASLELLHELKEFLTRTTTHDPYTMSAPPENIFRNHNFLLDLIPNLGGNCYRLCETVSRLPWGCRSLLSGYLFQSSLSQKNDNSLCSATMALSPEFVLNYPFELLPRFEEVTAVNARKELNWRKGFSVNVHLPTLDYSEGKLAQKIVEEFFSLLKLSDEKNKISKSQIIENIQTVCKLLDELLDLLNKQRWMEQKIIDELKFIFISLKKEMIFALDKIHSFTFGAAFELEYELVKGIWQKMSDANSNPHKITIPNSR